MGVTGDYCSRLNLESWIVLIWNDERLSVQGISKFVELMYPPSLASRSKRAPDILDLNRRKSLFTYYHYHVTVTDGAAIENSTSPVCRQYGHVVGKKCGVIAGVLKQADFRG